MVLFEIIRHERTHDVDFDAISINNFTFCSCRLSEKNKKNNKAIKKQSLDVKRGNHLNGGGSVVVVILKSSTRMFCLYNCHIYLIATM